MLNRIQPPSWLAESRSHICLYSFVWRASQAPLFSKERWLFHGFFSALAKFPKQSQNFFVNSQSTPHLGQGGTIGISWFRELTDLSSLASRTLYVTALLLSGGGFKAGYIPAYLTRLFFQFLQCSVIHSAIVTMLTKGKHCFLS